MLSYPSDLKDKKKLARALFLIDRMHETIVLKDWLKSESIRLAKSSCVTSDVKVQGAVLLIDQLIDMIEKSREIGDSLDDLKNIQTDAYY